MEKDELPSAQEQMGMYRRQQIQSRMRDQDLDTDALDNYVRERFVAPSQSYAEVGEDQASLHNATTACLTLRWQLEPSK